MKKFEYKYVGDPDIKGKGVSFEELNKLGDEGWQLVTSHMSHDGTWIRGMAMREVYDNRGVLGSPVPVWWPSRLHEEDKVGKTTLSDREDAVQYTTGKYGVDKPFSPETFPKYDPGLALPQAAIDWGVGEDASVVVFKDNSDPEYAKSIAESIRNGEYDVCTCWACRVIRAFKRFWTGDFSGKENPEK